MNILGINAWHGDVSAVLIRDGKLLVALEEERFRRVKHWAGFPEMSIKKCLEIANMKSEDIDHVAISRDPGANLMKKIGFVLKKRPAFSMLRERLRNTNKVRDIRESLSEVLNIPKDNLPDVHNVEHHPAHLASAFFVSPFEESAVGAIDGFGDFVSTSFAMGNGNKMEILDKVYYPHSLGLFYTAITQYLGFLDYGAEFKVMGLAPYGNPRYVDEITDLIKLKEGGKFELNLPYFRHWSDDIGMEWEDGYPSMGRVHTDKLDDLLGLRRDPEEPVKEKHEDIARSLQVVYEKAAFHVLNGLWEKTRSENLCLAGGCAMNSVANGKIRENTPFKNVYIQPAAADNGTALGAAYWLWNQVLDQSRVYEMEHAFCGTDYKLSSFKNRILEKINELDDQSGSFEVLECKDEDELCSKTAKKIEEGNVVGWFQGKMEWGSRALGNRSILADPRREDMRELINTKIKFREKFRPFAPSILEESLHDIFENAVTDPFMQQVYPVKPEYRKKLPAITHVDGSGRLQTVSKKTNQRYHKLIEEFEELSGIPVLLNTSFNENEPIVDTPDQALDCFLRTNMDVLVLDNLMISRKQ